MVQWTWSGTYTDGACQVQSRQKLVLFSHETSRRCRCTIKMSTRFKALQHSSTQLALAWESKTRARQLAHPLLEQPEMTEHGCGRSPGFPWPRWCWQRSDCSCPSPPPPAFLQPPSCAPIQTMQSVSSLCGARARRVITEICMMPG